jgi:hypothetical protein
MPISVHKSLGPSPHQQFRGRNEMGLNEMQQSETRVLGQDQKISSWSVSTTSILGFSINCSNFVYTSQCVDTQNLIQVFCVAGRRFHFGTIEGTKVIAVMCGLAMVCLHHINCWICGISFFSLLMWHPGQAKGLRGWRMGTTHCRSWRTYVVSITSSQLQLLDTRALVTGKTTSMRFF